MYIVSLTPTPIAYHPKPIIYRFIYRKLAVYPIKQYTDLSLSSAAAKRFEKKTKNDKKISEMLGKIRKEIEGKNK